MKPFKLSQAGLRYKLVIGTGGVGYGTIFVLDDNHTLGREESRGGYFLDRRDYCKLHIITHYLQVLLADDLHVIPASMVGQDDHGARLLNEMSAIGLDVRYMDTVSNTPTLYSFCFAYPDGSGGNLTTSNAATSLVTPEFIDRLEPEFEKYTGHGVVLAAPEVSLASRDRLLELGGKYHFWRVAAFTHAELSSGQTSPLLEKCDLIALNLNEAEALACLSNTDLTARDIIDMAMRKMLAINPRCILSITAGKQGSWYWDGKVIIHTPSIPLQVVNSAGAGDAHLAGVMIGIIAGLNYRQAHQLAALIAGCKVTSEHTIHPELDSQFLRDFARQHLIQLDPVIESLMD